jgi:hypothetical protein
MRKVLTCSIFTKHPIDSSLPLEDGGSRLRYGIKAKFFTLICAAALLALTLSGCSGLSNAAPLPSSNGAICLYGETHGVESMYQKELELWSEYYHADSMRHLFLELPYYTAEYLNLWMKSDNDDILNELYNDWEGTLTHVPAVLEFYKGIKRDCPETVFHGTDVGHQYDSIGKRYMDYLVQEAEGSSERYTLAQEAIEQGKLYYNSLQGLEANEYRENMMVNNFIREANALNGQSIMGIYGGQHTDLKSFVQGSSSVLCMAAQLSEHYNDRVYCQNLYSAFNYLLLIPVVLVLILVSLSVLFIVRKRKQKHVLMQATTGSNREERLL